MARLTEALRSGFEIGASTGGQFSAVGKAIKGIADDLKEGRLSRREITGKKALLGEAERVKALYRPTTQSIVGPTGEVVGKRPAGSVFQPSEKEPTTFQRQLVGGIRQLKAENASFEEIRQFINFSGANPEDFADEIGDYQPAPKKSFLKGLSDLFKR